jgi:hypothetical protein
MNLITNKVEAKHELLFNKPASEVGLLNISKSDLSSTTKCAPNHILDNYEFDNK